MPENENTVDMGHIDIGEGWRLIQGAQTYAIGGGGYDRIPRDRNFSWAEPVRVPEPEPEPIPVCEACRNVHLGQPVPTPEQCLWRELSRVETNATLALEQNEISGDWYVLQEDSGEDGRAYFIGRNVRLAYRTLRYWNLGDSNPPSWLTEMNYYDDQYSDDDTDGENDPCRCSACYSSSMRGARNPEHERPGTIHTYSYKPRPTFFGDGPVFLGMELEVNHNSGGSYGDITDELREAARHATTTMGGLGYLKEDSSVTGFEIVTEPMSYRFARERFPWDMLRGLRVDHGCSTSNDTGLHVHVSRAGFGGTAHRFRWFKLWYRNQDAIRALARRDSHWGSFSERERLSQKYYVKAPRSYGVPEADGRFRDRYGYPSYPPDYESPDRQAAINVWPEETFEVRVFKASLARRKVLAALGLVDASVEYTRKLTSHDIATKGAWSFDRFREWVGDQGDLYRELQQEMGALL